MQKGQLSIEVIILIAIFMLFFQAMLLPSIEFSENILKDTHAIIETKKSMDSIGSIVEQFANTNGYGKRLVFFYLPQNSQITDCNNATKEIHYKIQISNQKPIPVGCDENGLCKFSKKLLITNTLSCQPIGPGYSGSLMVEKQSTGALSIETP